MKIKSYFADSIGQAMEKARVELGPEAMLVSSKKVESELKHLGTYEVVFGLSQETTQAKKPLRLTAAPALEAVAPVERPANHVAQELADLRKQIETVSRSVSRQNYQLRWTGGNAWPELQELQAQLLAADFSEEMAQELVHGVQSRVEEEHRGDGRRSSAPRGALSPEALQAALHEEIESRLSVAPELGRSGDRRIVVFVGAPGSGKTTSLVKLAVREGIAARVPVQILSTDTLRLGGAEQLAAYARIIGAGFQAVHSTSALEQALEEYKTKKLLLIDTPGYDAANLNEAAELIAFLSRNPHIEVQLVLPASLRSTTAARMLQRFAAFSPSKLLFTRVDEAETAGALIEPALRSGLPVSFLSKGQQIPEDLEAASIERLLERLPAPALAARVSAA